MSNLKVFDDIDFAVDVKVEEYRLWFKIYLVIGREYGGGPVQYQDKNRNYTAYTDDLDKAELFAHGYVKFDSCSNWHFDIDEEIMWHACSRYELFRVGDVLSRCWDIAKDHFANGQFILYEQDKG